MNTFSRLSMWMGTLAVALFFWLAVTACDSSYEVIVDEVSIAKGTASGKLRIDGRSREFSGVADGEVIELELDGFKFKGKLKKGSQFTIKQGGLIVVQVPDGIVAGRWIAVNDLTGDTAVVALGTALPAPMLDSAVRGFVAEPGHRLLYGRLPVSFRDADWRGSLAGELGFDSRALGPRTFKMLIAGIVTVYEPGAPRPVEYIFPEFPMVYDFALVAMPRNHFDAYLVDGSWSLLSARDATTLGLPDPTRMQYAALRLDGASESELAPTMMIERGTRSTTGPVVPKSALLARGTVVVGFDRSAFYGVVDSSLVRQIATLRGSISALPYANDFAFEATLTFGSTSDATDASATGNASLRVVGNPVRDGKLRAEFQTSAPGPVRLTLVDARGRVVATELIEPRSAAPQVTTLDVSDLAAGAYALTLSSGAARVTQMVTIVR
jgi:hypothetical protein